MEPGLIQRLQMIAPNGCLRQFEALLQSRRCHHWYVWLSDPTEQSTQCIASQFKEWGIFMFVQLVSNYVRTRKTSTITIHQETRYLWFFMYFKILHAVTRISNWISCLIDWLVFYGTSTQDRSICAYLPGGITGSGVEDSQYKNIQLHAIQWTYTYM